MNMADKINQLMKKNNIKNPKELSIQMENQNLKIPYTTLLTIINDEVQDIKLGTARKLCKFFKITLDELFDDDISLDDNSFRYAANNGINVDDLDDKDVEEIKEYVNFKRNKKSNGTN